MIFSNTMTGKEYCVHCGEPTGRAGRYDDSLFLYDHQAGEYGPLCEECYRLIKLEEKGYWI